MYWKQGFYDTPIEGGLEITEEYWQQLLDGQAIGKIITEDESGYPILVDYTPSLEEVRNNKILKIQEYDKSSNVNSFYIDGQSMWLDKETRLGLVNSINLQKKQGVTITILWYNSRSYTLDCDIALDMLDKLELYAISCYNTTQSHIANINLLADKSSIELYNYTSGYPEKLNFLTK